jgi:hypothetical protein
MIIKNWITSFYPKLTTINDNSENKNISAQTNPFPHIFTSVEGYKLFERWRSENYNQKHTLVHFSYIYRVLIKDRFMHETVRASDYTRWLDQEFEISIEKPKQLHICQTDTRDSLYSTIKDLVKQNQ